MGLKRKLFPELSSGPVPEVSVTTIATRKTEKSRPQRQKTKRNATATTMVQGDSLASVLLGKENIVPAKPRGVLRQRKDISKNKNHEETKNHNVFKPSVLMVLDAKGNSSDNKERKEKKQSTRQQKVNLSQKRVTKVITKAIGNRRLHSNAIGGILVCFDTDNKCGSSSRASSLDVRRTKKATRSKAKAKTKTKTKRDKRNNKNKKLAKLVHRDDSLPNGDSLMMCLADSSTTVAESSLVGTEFTQKTTIPCDQRRKRIDKRRTKDRSILGESKDAPTPGKKSQNNSKRSTAASCKAGGLGAFVGITGEGLRHGNSRKEPRIRRFVSPLEGDLKTNSSASMSVKVLKSSKQEIDKTTKDTTSDTSALDGVPPVIIVSFTQRYVQLQQQISLQTANTSETRVHMHTTSTKDEPITEPSKVERRRLLGPSEIAYTIETRPKNETSAAPVEYPKETKQKSTIQKYRDGTKFFKHFRFHGWFMGKIVGFQSKTGFYNVLYEDGDVEELDECELDECKLQPDGPTLASSDEQRQRKINPIINQNDDTGAQNPMNNLKQNPSSVCCNQKEPVLDGSLSKDSSKKPQSKNDEKCTKNERPVEEGALLRRSRRSSEPSRLVDSTQSIVTKNIQISEVGTSCRRSKRRRSQPIRLIDLDSSIQNQSIQSTGRRKRERSEQKSKMGTKESRVTKDPKARIDDRRESTNNGNLDLALDQNRSSSPSNHDDTSHKKQDFDDALRAVMPLEDNAKRLTRDPCQIEDDIFDSTPMRELFTRSISNASEPDVTNQRKEKNRKTKRRSRRKSIEPERYGHSADSVTKSSKKHIKSAMKKGKRKVKRSSTAKKKVRISNELPRARTIDSHDKTEENDVWTQADLKALHRAHRIVDPTSFSFWEDVSEIIADRSAEECRHKWFSLAKTPEPKKQKQKKQGKRDIDTTDVVRSFDDDIFNSTPMRSAFAIGESIDISDTAFEELGEISNINVGSAIKINKIDHNDGCLPSNHDLTSCPHGYKTYLQKMGRSMRQKDTKKTQTYRDMNQPSFKIGKKLAERVDEGDVQVKGRLSPGGTLRVDTFGDTDTEDYLDYEDEDE